MSNTSDREIRKIKYRNEPYYIYYVPGTSFRAHDHNYVLRLLSDKLAYQNPADFCLLPQYRSLGMNHVFREANPSYHSKNEENGGTRTRETPSLPEKASKPSGSDPGEQIDSIVSDTE